MFSDMRGRIASRLCPRPAAVTQSACPSARERTAFSVAFIALAAKLAKADGRVTRDEVRMFRETFHVPPKDERRVGRFYDLCRRDAAGYEVYARRIARLTRRDPGAGRLREDVLDGLFRIAMADGVFDPGESAFLDDVARILEVPAGVRDALRARHVPGVWSPRAVLGLSSGAGPDEARRAWRRLVRDNHPDQVRATGASAEVLRLATARMADINRAYEEIKAVDFSPENGAIFN